MNGAPVWPLWRVFRLAFEKIIRIPKERVAVLIGPSGSVKSRIAESCGVELVIDSATGEVTVSSGDLATSRPFKAVEIVMAIGRGFSPESGMDLLRNDNILQVIDLREFAGKSRSSIERIKGRIIGEGGRARRNMESLSGTRISVYGRTVSVIGSGRNLRLAVDAITSLSGGNMHGAVYKKMEAANRRTKQAGMALWEGRDVYH